MSNETVKRFDIIIKLRRDNVYDLYIDSKWVASRGCYNGIAEEVKNAMKKSLIGE